MINLIIISFSTFLFSTSLQATDLASLKITSTAVPYEMELMFNHLKEQTISREQKEKLLADLEVINDDLSAIGTKANMFLMKSEILKGILTNQYLKKEARVQVSSSTVDSIQKKVQSNKVIYSNFSAWIIKSILNDLSEYSKNNFLNKYENVSRSNSKDTIKAKKLKKLLKYTSSLINSFLRKSPEEFNHLVTNITLDTISRLALKSYYFKALHPHQNIGAQPLFQIPTLKKSPPTSSPETPQDSIERDSFKQKVEAQKEIQKINSPDMSPASKSIDQINTEQ